MQQDKQRRRKVFIGLIGSAALIAAIGSGLLLWPRNVVRVRSPLPRGWTFVERNSFDRQPWLDLPWLGGQRLKYPAPVAMPKGFKNHPDLAGILLPEPPKSGMMSPSAMTMLYLAIANWRCGDRINWMRDESNRFVGADYYFPIPYVFGNDKVRAEVSWPSYPPDPSLTNRLLLDLPANGVEAPTLDPVKVDLGGWRVYFKPQPWLGPSFRIVYEVTAEGLAKNDLAVCRIEGVGIGSTTDILLQPGRPSIVAVSPQLKAKSAFKVTVFRRHSFTATVVPSMTPASPDVKDGKKTIGTVFTSGKLVGILGGTVTRRSTDTGKEPKLRVGDIWVDNPPLDTFDITKLMEQYTKSKTSLIIGAKIPSERFVPIESRRGTISFKLPSAKQYPSCLDAGREVP